jgi:hypothetical protein
VIGHHVLRLLFSIKKSWHTALSQHIVLSSGMVRPRRHGQPFSVEHRGDSARKRELAADRFVGVALTNT